MAVIISRESVGGDVFSPSRCVKLGVNKSRVKGRISTQLCHQEPSGKNYRVPDGVSDSTLPSIAT